MFILGNAIEDFFSSGGFLEFGFREHGPPQPEASTSGRDSETPPVDVEAIKRVYDKILKLYDTEVRPMGVHSSLCTSSFALAETDAFVR